MTQQPTIVWFRRDLRLADNRALYHAVGRGAPVIPIYIWSPEAEGGWSPGAAARWWLRESLQSLDSSLRDTGSKLTIRSGDPLVELSAIARETGATHVFFNARVEPAARNSDEELVDQLRREGLDLQIFDAASLFNHKEILTNSGAAYQRFTPFWLACRMHHIAQPLEAPQRILTPEKLPESHAISLEPVADKSQFWQPGEKHALQNLDAFLANSLENYPEVRDRPSLDGTSQLSPYLRFGEISPRLIWRSMEAQWGDDTSSGASIFAKELIWREFAYYLLLHFPEITDEPLQRKFEHFPFLIDDTALEAWKYGRTGYPIVDAGIRQMLATGWMHNRVRMIVASFLTKHLLMPWTIGARWFWENLVDADLANNTLGWQWSAGCGPDAMPFVRIFNPMLQGATYDPDGDYVRRWVPELQSLRGGLIHAPWRAPAAELSAIKLGHDYPNPIVDHLEARERALEAFHSIR